MPEKVNNNGQRLLSNIFGCFHVKHLKVGTDGHLPSRKHTFPSFDIRDSSIGLFTMGHFSLLYTSLTGEKF